MATTEKASKKKHTLYHVLVLDRSGSMSTVQDVTVSGFNENLQSLKSNKLAEDIEEKVCLVTFAGDVRCDVWKQNADSVPDLNHKTYVPKGGTALYDALGITVTRLNDEIRDEIKSQDANVVVTIFTDGDENSSVTEWADYTKLSALRAELESSRMWTFTFIGCSEEQLRKTTAHLGFSHQNTMSYVATTDGTRDAFSKLCSSRESYREKVTKSVALKDSDNVSYQNFLVETQNNFFDEIKPKEEKEVKP